MQSSPSSFFTAVGRACGPANPKTKWYTQGSGQLSGANLKALATADMGKRLSALW
jgi:hypothetical protein